MVNEVSEYILEQRLKNHILIGTIEDIFLHITRVLVDRKQYLPKKRQPTYLPMEEEPVASNSSCC